MPKSHGQKITIANGQPQREVSHFHCSVSYDADMVPRFSFAAFTTVRLRDADNAVIHQGDQTQLIALADGQIPAPVRAAFTAIVNKLDTLD
jgi:hypothetical protein